jgi:AcrR family transcriptional regulator
MGIAERKEIEKEALKNKILAAASEILVKEGYENLSIRKIARLIDYSPGTIYHYFKDKSEIVSHLAEQGYGKILKKMGEIPLDEENPEKTVIKAFKAYIDLALESPLEYRAILLSDIEEIREKIEILAEGISKKRKSLSMLQQLIELGMTKGKFRPVDPELTAQIIWAATFGLLTRLLVEKNVSPEQKERLINHHFEILFHGILK